MPGYARGAWGSIGSLGPMLLAALYASVRLILDLARVRLALTDAEAEVVLLRHQLRVLRRQVGRPRLEPGDRLILAALGTCLRRTLAANILVRPETVLGWHRELVRRKWAAFGRRAGVGRPGLDEELRRLILEMARDNPRWGCVRIRGELLKIGHQVSASAIRRLLRRRGIGPAPERSRLTWTAFLRTQASALVVTDFFTVDTIFLKRLYVLVHMELARRRVIRFAVTEHPDSAWVAQQTRNLVWELETIGTRAQFLVRDNDAKFSGPADAVLTAEGIQVIKTPIAAPRANAFMERQIGSTRRECLDWTLVLNRRHLERVLTEWVEHYNQERPHRSLDLATPVRPQRRSRTTAVRGVVRRDRLGGLLREYSAVAA